MDEGRFVFNIFKNWAEGHRGDFSEEIINRTNDYFLKEGLAMVSKIPTPVKVLKRKGYKIVDGFFEQKGILDYVGVCQGLPVAFDSKETNAVSLPLSNIPKHQLRYIQNFLIQGGYAFIICNFKRLDRFYLIPGEIVLDYYKNSLKGGRKSIPEKELDRKYEIKLDKRNYVLNYLVPLNNYYNDRKNQVLEGIKKGCV